MSLTLWPGAMRDRERRTLVLGLLALLLITGVGRGLPAWRRALIERRAAATGIQHELASAQRALARQKTIRDTLGARNARLSGLSATLLPGGGDAGAAGRALAAMISGAAAGAEVRLTTTSVLEDARIVTSRPAIGEGARTRREAAVSGAMLRTIAVRIVGNADVRGLATLLETLERGPARLRVRSLTVSQPEVAAADDRVESLQLELVVEGLAAAYRDTTAARDARTPR